MLFSLSDAVGSIVLLREIFLGCFDSTDKSYLVGLTLKVIPRTRCIGFLIFCLIFVKVKSNGKLLMILEGTAGLIFGIVVSALLSGAGTYFFFHKKIKSLHKQLEEIKKEYKKSLLDFDKKQKEFDLEIRARAKKLESVQSKLSTIETQLQEKETSYQQLKSEWEQHQNKE